MTDVKVMSVTFLLPAGRSRDRDRFSHGSDVPYDYISPIAVKIQDRKIKAVNYYVAELHLFRCFKNKQLVRNESF